MKLCVQNTEQFIISITQTGRELLRVPLAVVEPNDGVVKTEKGWNTKQMSNALNCQASEKKMERARKSESWKTSSVLIWLIATFLFLNLDTIFVFGTESLVIVL